jgi:hypothetical protein
MQPVLTKAEPAETTIPVNSSTAPAPPKIEMPIDSSRSSRQRETQDVGDEDEEDWENVSLYEQVLDDTEPYEYAFGRFQGVLEFNIDD